MMLGSTLAALLSFALVATLTGGSAIANERTLGVMLDAGVPDGAQASVVYRPLPWLRLHGGGGYNLISHGVRVGATWTPLHTAVRPVLVAEAGRFFEGDANPLMRQFAGDHQEDSAALSNIGYDYANAHAGIEIGSERFTFYLHAGYSEVRGHLRGLDAMFNEDMSSPSIQFESAPSARALIPSGRLGLISYFR